jgi:hypothetical protein
MPGSRPDGDACGVTPFQRQPGAAAPAGNATVAAMAGLDREAAGAHRHLLAFGRAARLVQGGVQHLLECGLHLGGIAALPGDLQHDGELVAGDLGLCAGRQAQLMRRPTRDGRRLRLGGHAQQQRGQQGQQPCARRSAKNRGHAAFRSMRTMKPCQRHKPPDR